MQNGDFLSDDYDADDADDNEDGEDNDDDNDDDDDERLRCLDRWSYNEHPRLHRVY